MIEVGFLLFLMAATIVIFVVIYEIERREKIGGEGGLESLLFVGGLLLFLEFTLLLGVLK